MDPGIISPGTARMIIVIVALVITILITIVKEFYYPKSLITLGKKDVWWSPVRLKPPPDRYAVIVKNSPDGAFHKFIHSVYMHDMDKNFNFVPRSEKDEDEENSDDRKPRFAFLRNLGNALLDLVTTKESSSPTFFEKFMEDYLEPRGLVWVGFFKAYRVKPIQYTAWDKLPGSHEFGAVPRKRNLTPDDPYYLYQYTSVYIEVTKVEIQGNIGVRLGILITIRHRNPYLAQFRVEDWIVRSFGLVERVIREFSSDKTFDVLRKLKEQKGDDLLARLNEAVIPGQKDDGSHSNQSFTERYGIEFEDPELIEVELEKDEATEKALKAKELAVIGLEAATVQNQEIALRADGEVARINKVYGAIASHRDGALIALSEKLDKSKLQTLVLGNSPIAVTAPTEK